MAARSWLLAIALAAAVAGGCAKPAPYQCATGDDCGPGGVCGADGTCTVIGEVDAPGATPPAACFVGAALPRVDGACTGRVCDVQSSCCMASWTRPCVALAERECDLACGGRIAWATTDVSDVRDFALVGGVLTDTPLPSYGATGQFYRGVYWADFDRDERVELVVSTANGNNGGDQQLLLRARADGWDTARDLREIGATTYEAFEASVGDFDDDDRLDLAVVGSYPGVVLFSGHPSASLVIQGPPVPADIEPYLGATLDFGDYDGDGDDDLVVFDYSQGHGKILRWTGSVFEPAATLGPFTTPRRATFGDVDRDGDLDLAIADSGEARVLRNTGGTFEPTPLWMYAQPNADFADAAWIDADSDGDLDLVLADGQYDGAPIRLFENTGADLADQPVFSSVMPESVWRLAIGDIDGDGDPDVALASQYRPNRIYLNDGDLTLSVGWTAPTVRPSFSVAVTRP